jgi:ABC-2 type transport system ATP-binding protein
MREEIKMTIFITTHYMDEADSLCDRIAIIDRGKIKVMDTPSALKSSLGNEIVLFKFSSGETDEVSSAIEKLRKLPFVKSITDAGIKGYIASVNNGEASIPAIFETLQGMHAKIGQIVFKQSSLDDVFIHHTGREMREAGGGKENAVRSRIMMRRTRK